MQARPYETTSWVIYYFLYVYCIFFSLQATLWIQLVLLMNQSGGSLQYYLDFFTVPYLCPAVPVIQIASTVRYHTYDLLSLSFK